MTLALLKADLKKLNNPQKAKVLSRFFKTGKGEYGEGDIFLGITVPDQRKIAIKYKNLSLIDIELLLRSKYHEERLVGILILVHNFQNCSLEKQHQIVEYYLRHTKYINNWDLVDLSADKIFGEYLYQMLSARGEGISGKSALKLNTLPFSLSQLAKSHNIWDRRISMISTYAFIKRGFSEPALSIAKILVNDKHDLMQKAVGWMLREIGKRVDPEIEKKFLDKHYRSMPRTMLRYAIEKFPEKIRKKYLTGEL